MYKGQLDKAKGEGLRERGGGGWGGESGGRKMETTVLEQLKKRTLWMALSFTWFSLCLHLCILLITFFRDKHQGELVNGNSLSS